MAIYKIQHKITTIAHNAIMNGEKHASFYSEDINFRHANFSISEGWRSDYWYANFEVETSTRADAFNIFISRLRRIIPRISLLSQCCITYANEPFVLTRLDAYVDVALFRFVRDGRHVGLMFLEGQKQGLDILMLDKIIPDEFFLYWNDAVNTTGYSSKLLLMFSAIEAMARKRDKGFFPNKQDLYEEVLGTTLSIQIFGDRKGLRNRLAHGEYFSVDDEEKDYLNIVHKAVVNYFNKKIFKDKIIAEDVVNPQRNPFGGNKEGWGPGFLRKKPGTNLDFSIDSLINKEPKVSPNTSDFEIIYGKEAERLNRNF